MAVIVKLEVKPPRFPVVTHEGLVKLIPVAPHITTALEEVEGQISVRKVYENKGWVLLQDLYLQEGRQDLWQAWLDHRKALEQARKDSLQIESFPDKYLPREVHRRRAGHRPMAKTWKMPELPPVDMDEPEVPAPVKRGGRKPKVEIDPEG